MATQSLPQSKATNRVRGELQVILLSHAVAQSDIAPIFIHRVKGRGDHRRIMTR